MEKCNECKGEGLIHQGESIHQVCEVCRGTGQVGELSEVNEANKMEEGADVASSEITASESFLGEASEGSAESSEEAVAE